MLVIALPGAARIAAGIAQCLGADWSELAVHRFPDGESLVRIDVPVKGRCVVFAGSLNDPDARTLPLLFAADCARELGASQVGLAAPYLAYLRQDRRFNPGEAVSSRSYARLLSSSLDFLATVDPHLHRWRSLGEIYPIRAQAVSAAPAIAPWIADHVADPLLIGPDAESAPWVEQAALLCGAPWAVMEKVRHGDRQVSVRAPAGVDWKSRTPVLLDDIVSSGATLLAAVEALARAGARPPVCVAVHALPEGDAVWKLMAAGVTRFASCDSIAHASNAIGLAPLLAQAVRRLASVPVSSTHPERHPHESQ
ncbi:ribose-phosphate diphosphokinase [Caenimonas aquaedulcis]|uniref:Ribose-phosphate diphosphokinase n=1 Tax=Caenimonas aquaedulcis TaxID=2793270 RepID=A0A931H7P3_9BURK|nr:ribose-phosphate diphosphokinase [Caenimonas aquaedulcis]MBG9390219.1 ribose-phosphate diphosphokinase [Caenimonas aquaedulcis]